MNQIALQSNAIRSQLTIRARSIGSGLSRGASKFQLALVLACAGLSFTHADAQNNAPDQDPAVMEAIARDLNLTQSGVRARIEAERASYVVGAMLDRALGTTFAGAWFDANERDLVVATTNPQATAEITRIGARPVVVERSMQQLNDLVRQLDEAALQLSQEQLRSIYSWGIDVTTNSVTISISADDIGAEVTARDLVTLSRADRRAIRIEQSTQGAPRLFQSNLVRGGDFYANTTDSLDCSIGFSVNGGYVTAGHCSGGTTGDAAIGYNGLQQGVFVGSTFPSEDRAWVTVNGNWTPTPCVGTGSNRNCSSSANVPVYGSVEAFAGHTVCRYGATTGGPHCGLVQAKNVTIVLDGVNTVHHLTQTSACADFGDSGGPYVWANMGQGTLSGGSGNCTSGGTTYFYPLNLTLSHFGLSLLTAGIADSMPVNVGNCSAIVWRGVAPAMPPLCPAIGSLPSPTLSTGQTVTKIASACAWGAQTQLAVTGFTSDPGASWLLTATINGLVMTPGASYSYSAGTATWGFNGAVFGCGPTYPSTATLTITHQ